MFADGNSSTAHGQCALNAENRLTKVEPGGTAQTGNEKVEFKYDYQGRRIEKKVWEYDRGWTLTRHCEFLYDGWLLLLELDGAQGEGGTGVSPVRSYTWGRDLSGLQGRGTVRGRAALSRAGGIGGLLAVYDADEEEDYVYFHDALGNVGQVVDLGAATASVAMMVKYEYDPYGSRTNTATQGEYEQPFRFSTKYYDDETGLSYFGYRYYNAVLGRWISRDPAADRGGVNLYGYVRNRPVGLADWLGHFPIGGLGGVLCGPGEVYDPDLGCVPAPAPPPLPLYSSGELHMMPPGLVYPRTSYECYRMFGPLPPGYSYAPELGICKVVKTGPDPLPLPSAWSRWLEKALHGNCCGTAAGQDCSGSRQPIAGDAMDEACKEHDQCMSTTGSFTGPPVTRSERDCHCALLTAAFGAVTQPGSTADAYRIGIKTLFCPLVDKPEFPPCVVCATPW